MMGWEWKGGISQTGNGTETGKRKKEKRKEGREEKSHHEILVSFFPFLPCSCFLVPVSLFPPFFVGIPPPLSFPFLSFPFLSLPIFGFPGSSIANRFFLTRSLTGVPPF